MNRTLIITLFILTNSAAPMIAMRRGLRDQSNPFIQQIVSENKKIEELLNICVALPLGAPLTDELLLKENPWWQDVRNWPQDEKNQLLRKAIDGTLIRSWNGNTVCDPQKYQTFKGHMALAVAIGASPQIKSLRTPSVTPLAISLEQGDPVLTRYLVEKGTLVDKERAKSFLIKTKNGQMAEMLLEWGAAIPENILFERFKPAEVMAVYLKRGVNPNQSKNDETPLHQIADIFSGGTRDSLAKATLLIEAGINTEAQNFSGYTALHVAAECGEIELCKTIVNGCIGVRRKYQATMIALLHCMGNTKRRPAFQGGCQLPKLPRDIVASVFGSLLRPPHMSSPLKLLSIKNVNGYTPYGLFLREEREKVEEFMNPENYAPVQGIEKK
jgi:hypothetical protein